MYVDSPLGCWIGPHTIGMNGEIALGDDYENDLTRSFSIFKESLMAVGLRSRVSTEDVSKGQPLVPYFGIDETQSVLVVRACHLATIS
jgi:hypothetical protein